jgi:hypothetical protein
MKYQNLYNIVFSDVRSTRWKRHFLFWLAVVIYHLVRIGFMLPGFKNMAAVLDLFSMTFWWGLLPNVFFTYTTAYYLVPKYFNKKKYLVFFLGVLLLMLLIQVYNMARNFMDLNLYVKHAIGISEIISFDKFRPGIIRTMGNPPLILGLFLSLKTLKNWHLEQLKTESIARETANAELQMLKAQVHPHFLFNTLNNIYSFTLNQSPQAAELVRKLSGMLGYMIRECNEKLVPLEKEIRLIEDYIGLEKVRYGTRLDLQVKINGVYENKLIAPLLLIPFVENCFKHGASIMRGQQWIRLMISIEGDRLDFTMSNTKPPQLVDTSSKKGIGLANVQKRLQLIYPGNHSLAIESTPDVYTVHLQIHLQHVAGLGINDQLISKPKAVLYE